MIEHPISIDIIDEKPFIPKIAIEVIPSLKVFFKCQILYIDYIIFQCFININFFTILMVLNIQSWCSLNL